MTDRKALDRWARDAGWADFDTYIAAGNSILDARRDVLQRLQSLQTALLAIDGHNNPPQPPEQTDRDEPPDPDNAHPQGDDDAP